MLSILFPQIYSLKIFKLIFAYNLFTLPFFPNFQIHFFVFLRNFKNSSANLLIQLISFFSKFIIPFKNLYFQKFSLIFFQIFKTIFFSTQYSKISVSIFYLTVFSKLPNKKILELIFPPLFFFKMYKYFFYNYIYILFYFKHVLEFLDYIFFRKKSKKLSIQFSESIRVFKYVFGKISSECLYSNYFKISICFLSSFLKIFFSNVLFKKKTDLTLPPHFSRW